MERGMCVVAMVSSLVKASLYLEITTRGKMSAKPEDSLRISYMFVFATDRHPSATRRSILLASTEETEVERLCI
jgi:hypothetical protein